MRYRRLTTRQDPLIVLASADINFFQDVFLRAVLYAPAAVKR